jgi:sugar phosphate isomerase/epimerase
MGAQFTPPPLAGEVRAQRGAGASLFSRRALIGGASSFAALAAAGCARDEKAPAAPAATLQKLGIQLFTMRDPIARDVAGVFETLALWGYEEVEGFGDLNTPVDDLKKMLSDAGLVMPSAHISRDRIRDNPAPEIERAAAMGYEYAVLNWLAPEERDTLDKYRAWADTCNSFAAACKAVNVKFAYHNHDFEFAPIDGTVPYNLLLERCDPELVKFELDLYWATKGGVDLPSFLDQHGARIPMVHVKDMDAAGAMADVGAGVIDFHGLFAKHKFEHYYVERDDARFPLQSAEASYRGLRDALAP